AKPFLKRDLDTPPAGKLLLLPRTPEPLLKRDIHTPPTGELLLLTDTFEPFRNGDPGTPSRRHPLALIPATRPAFVKGDLAAGPGGGGRPSRGNRPGRIRIRDKIDTGIIRGTGRRTGPRVTSG